MAYSNIFLHPKSTHIPPRVHYNLDSIEIILVFKDVDSFPVTRIISETPKEREMCVTLYIKSYKFREYASGPYYYDTVNPDICDKIEVSEVDNKDKPRLMIPWCFKLWNRTVLFTRQEVLASDKARNYQALLRWPSTSTFLSYVSKYLTKKWNRTVDDIKWIYRYIKSPHLY